MGQRGSECQEARFLAMQASIVGSERVSALLCVIYRWREILFGEIRNIERGYGSLFGSVLCFFSI